MCCSVGCSVSYDDFGNMTCLSDEMSPTAKRDVSSSDDMSPVAIRVCQTRPPSDNKCLSKTYIFLSDSRQISEEDIGLESFV